MSRILQPIVFALLLIGLAAVMAGVQQPSPIQVGKDSNFSFGFDWDGKDVDGNDDQVDACQFVFRPFPPAAPPVPPIRVLRTRDVMAGENLYPVKPILRNINEGEYTLTARLRDLGGNWSDESIGINILVTSKKPTRPTSLRVVGR